MSNILDLLFSGLCGITGGWYAREAWAAWYHRKNMQSDETSETEQLHHLEIRAEQHGSIHYLYDVNTNQFITQVRDYAEFLTYFEQHHPNTQIVMPRDQFEALQK